MTKFFGDEPPADDWLPDEDDIHNVCPQCGGDDLNYKGEVYDDEEYLGSGFSCNDCGLHFTEQEAADGTW